jgi:glutathione synthase/RimK-type ligase-like ATP-grasp enzyme
VGKVVHEKNIEIYSTMVFRPTTENISQMPIYIQKYICKKYEARLTFINRKMFAVRIDSEDKVDWRRNYAGNKYCKIEVPQNIVRNCINMMSDFDIIFGAFDFIINDRDEWIFLEVNPNGQWLWLECALKLPISNEIISYLVG